MKTLTYGRLLFVGSVAMICSYGPATNALVGQQNPDTPKLVHEQGLRWDEDLISIAGQIFDGVVWRDRGGGEAYIIYALSSEFSRFEAWIGVPDSSHGSSVYRFQLDGETVKRGKVDKGERAVKVVVDLVGASSFRIDVDGYMVNPKFIKADAPELKVPANVSPDDRAKVKGESVSLLWTPVDGATSYGIEIVSTKLDGEASDGAKRIWSFTTGSDPLHKLDLSEFKAGEYRWSVIAFDSKRALGAFSPSSLFRVTK